MPTGLILVAFGVCIIFLAFAFALAWADHTVSQWLRDRVSAKPPPNVDGQSDREAA